MSLGQVVSNRAGGPAGRRGIQPARASPFDAQALSNQPPPTQPSAVHFEQNVDAPGHRWNWSLGPATTNCFVAGILLLIGVCAITYRALNSFAGTAARVALTHQVQAEIGHLQRALIEAIAARRAYLANPHKSEQANLRAAAVRAGEHLTALRRLTADNLKQQTNIDELDRLLAGPIARSVDPSAPIPPPPPARGGNAPTTSQANSEQLLDIFGRINAEEESLRRGREQQAERNFELARRVVPTGTFASVQHRLLFQTSPLPMWVYDRETLRFLMVNEAATAVYGYSRDEFLAMTLRDIRPPEEVPALLQAVADVPRTPSFRNPRVWKHRRKDGTIMLVEVTSHDHGLLRDTVQKLEMATQGRNIVWKIAPLPDVIGDTAMLRQVFANVVGNAVKYTRHRNPAEIEISCADEEDGRAIILVRDNGAGFDMQYAHKLFGVFQRLHRSDEFEGTGIGLATVRRVISRHGGRVRAEGAVGKGATFYFTLERAAPERISPTNHDS